MYKYLNFENLKKAYYCLSITRHIRIIYYIFLSKCNACLKYKLNIVSVILFYLYIFSFLGCILILFDFKCLMFIVDFSFYIISVTGGYVVLYVFFESFDLFIKDNCFCKPISFVFMFFLPGVFLFYLTLAEIWQRKRIIKINLDLNDILNNIWLYVDKFIDFFKENWCDILMPDFWGCFLILFLFHYRSLSTFKKLKTKEKIVYLKCYKELKKIRLFKKGN